MLSKKGLLRLLTIVAAWLFVVSSATAIDIWDGGGGDAKWTTAANWDAGDTLPGFDGTDDITIGTGFASGTALDLDGNKNINSLTVAGGTSFSINNNALTLQSGDITHTASNSTLTLNSDVVLGADATWQHSAGRNITVNGVISDGGSGFGLTKTGTGTGGQLTLSGNNTYSGVTTVSQGSLYMTGAVAESTDGPLGNATSTVIIADGSTGSANIEFYANGGTFGRKIHVTNNGTGAIYLGGTGADNTYTNEIIFDRTTGARLYNNNSTSTFEGIISGSGNVLLERGIRLKAANTYIGTTTVGAGFGLGTRVAADAPNGAPGAFGDSTTAVSMQNSGIIYLDGAFTIGRNIDIPAGISVLTGSVNAATGTFGGGIAIGAGSTMSLNLAGQVNYDGVISGAGNVLRNGGSGNAAHFNATNTYTGTTELRIGSIFLGTHAPDGAPGALGNATSDVLFAPVNNAHITQVLTNGPYTVGRNFSLAGTSTAPNTQLGGNTADTSFFTGDIDITTAANEAKLTAAAAGTVRFSGDITGPGSVQKLGTGAVVLSGSANTYTGTTTVADGTLSVAANGALGATSAGTTVNSGRTLGFLGNVNYSDAEPVSIVGTGFGGVGAINNRSGDNAFAGPITLTGAASIGATAGTLSLSGGITTAGNALSISGTGGTVAIDGTVTGGTVSVLSGGIFSPGASPGTTTATGNFAIQNLGTYNYEIGHNFLNSTGQNDLIAVTGTLSLSSTWTLKLTHAGGVNPNGEDMLLFTYGTLGTLGSVLIDTNDVDNLLNGVGMPLYIFNSPAVVDDGNGNLFLTGVTILQFVPEPSSFLLLGLATLAVAGPARRRRRKA